MRPTFLHKRLTWIVCALILGTSLAIVVVDMARHLHSMRETTIREGEALAGSIAKAAGEKIGRNDLTSLKMLLYEHVNMHPWVAYMLVARDGRLLAHTCPDELHAAIAHAKPFDDHQTGSLVRYVSATQQNFWDIGMPVADGSGAILQVGLYEKSLRSTLDATWMRSGIITILVLSLALGLALFLISRLTRPLRHLASEAVKLDNVKLDFNPPRCAHQEINALSLSFGKMIDQVQSCSRSIETSSMALDRAYRQIFTSFDILRSVGTHSSLKGVCTFLVDRLKAIMDCDHLAMIVASKDRTFYFHFATGSLEVIPGEHVEAVKALLGAQNEVTFTKRHLLGIPMLDAHLGASDRIGIFPIHLEGQPIGALTTGCPRQCPCQPEGLKIAHHVLQECSGAIKRAADHAQDLQQISCQITRGTQFCGIVGKDRRMQNIFKLIQEIAPTEATVLIQGESGTGKELVARAIHEQSQRSGQPFVVINCAAYPATLLESELFGHEKGAFTGAIRKKIGRFEQADGGTVFMDEVGEIALSAQIKLLRVLQTHTFERVGGEQTLHVQVRVIAATNKNLIQEVQQGRFREDLYYRLNVIPINLPALRDRRNDIPLLARHFLNRFKIEQGKAVDDFRTETMRMLLEYSWPGNVRELENTIEHALLLAKGSQIDPAALPPTIRSAFKRANPPDKGPEKGKPDTVAANEKRLFKQILEETGWNKKLAAQRLGISRSTLYNKIKKYDLVQPTIH